MGMSSKQAFALKRFVMAVFPAALIAAADSQHLAKRL
jgi:hypothetical protein